MHPVVRNLCIALACYLAAWLLCFVLLVGFEPALAPSYFLMGWTFSGLELPTFIWFFSWPVFLVLYAPVYYLLRRAQLRGRRAD